MESKTKKGNDYLDDNVKDLDNYFLSKNIQGPCVDAFKKKILINGNYYNLLSEVIKLSQSGNLRSRKIHPIAWKMLLGILPCEMTSSLSQWVKVTKEQRRNYKKKVLESDKKKSKIKTSDPLNREEGNPWGIYFDDIDLRKLITLDINRTFQDRELFCENFIKDILNNVLFTWAKENRELSYKQGMNEILAIITITVFPYYFPFETDVDSLEVINDEMINNPLHNVKNIYMFFHDEAYLEADLFYLFSAIMKEGVIHLYENSKIQRNLKKIELFDDNINTNSEHLKKDTDWIFQRCGKMLKEKLSVYDEELMRTLNKSRIDCSTFLVKWYKCLFSREFHPEFTCVLWDAILSEEKIDLMNLNLAHSTREITLEFIDYICIAMLEYIKDQVIGKTENDILMRLFKYPPVESPATLIKLAQEVRAFVERQKKPITQIKDNMLGQGGNIMGNKKEKEKEIEIEEIININKKGDVNGKKTKFQKEFDGVKGDEKKVKDKIVQRLNEIRVKYIKSYSKEDNKDFEYILELINKKFNL